MRLVVGPLPASVYWRRRAMVLVGAAFAVFMIIYSCSVAGNSSKATGTGSSGSSPSAKPNATPTSSVAPSRAPVAPVSVSSASPTPVGVVDAQLCTDAELLVTAQPGKTTMPRGTELSMRLLIKNTSNRSCSRDVGPDQQELYIKVGTQVVFSSDHCDGPTGSDLRTFPPQHERSVDVSWNGKSSLSCSTEQKRTPNGPAPDAGEYQLFGRVGTDISEPVTIKLT